ncbi:MAG: prolyl oligopeptidase family serine peptidase [Vicinamibacterales bacterium]
MLLPRRVVVLLAAVSAAATLGAQAPGPSIDDILNLRRVGSPAISPDGQQVAFTIRETNWDENAYETEIWLGDVRGRSPRQLTFGAKSSLDPAWSPDGRWLAFISDRSGKRQVYRLRLEGGDAQQLTTAEEDVSAFAWSPDNTRIAYSMTDAVAEERKARDKKYGEFRIEDQDRRMAHLHVVDVLSGATQPLTSGPFVVGNFDWSPDATKIAFDHRISSDPADGASADISVVTLSTGERTVVVDQPGPDANPRWSPDGRQLAFSSAMAKPFFYYQNSVLAVTEPGSRRTTALIGSFDENPALVAWTPSGIFFSASQRTWAYLFKLDPTTKQVSRHAVAEEWIGTNFSITRDGRRVAFIGAGPGAFADVHLSPVSPTLAPVRISNMAGQVASWPAHAREVIRWKSQDGTEIEGVLHKPADFQPGRRYPLLIVIHGGPTGISRPVPYSNGAGYYPVDRFLARGALVLEPNYRGSAGYGETFRSLNVRNLGIGDAWDVLSGIDHLAAQGLVDPTRVGSMGWSQGGYISAFLTTRHASRFKAISVGAGISNWMTYYVNTDIHPFTRQYLQATPWDDPKIYADTSPMTYIKQARTPTLIQHGDGDQRVPPPNAFELYQGLRDQNVPVELVIFKGFGHGLTKPKANLAAMQQNEDWFVKYLWAASPTTAQ